MIVVNDLRKVFHDLRRGPVAAVDDVSFECHPGEIFGLLGLNGAGKTTAMRILSTVLRPTSGTAYVNGYDVVTEAADVRRTVGFLSNSTGLYDRMTAWEHVEYFGKLYGLGDDVLKERMESIFAELSMNNFRETLVSKMSTGMKQKVSIARAVVHDPPVLIFDEPTLGLDIFVARAVQENVLRLKGQGKCIIYSTHIMSEVEKLCDRIAIIHDGRILDQGPLVQLRERYQAPNVEELFFRLIDESSVTHI